MIIYTSIAIALATLYIIILLIYLIHNKFLLKGLLFNSASGLLFLVGIKLISSYIPLVVPINTVSVTCASTLGIPGVGLFFLINYLFL